MVKMRGPKVPKTLFKRYPGKRVAIVNGRVVAATNNIATSLRIAKEKYPDKEIALFAVPRKEDRHLLI
jgi:hypothetical protein